MKVRIFMAKTCAASKMYRTQLKKRGVSVEILDIEAEAALARTLDIRATPTTIIGDEKEEVRRLVGYSPDVFEILKEVLNGE